MTFSQQLSFEAMTEALALDGPDSATDHGEIFTRRWVVDLILDLVGYVPERDLGALCAVEPACGGGAFLVPMAERLLESCAIHGRPPEQAGDALRAFDLLDANVTASRQAIRSLLRDRGLPAALARTLAHRWVRSADFLLSDLGDRGADFVLGNPPYIRLENIPATRSAAYRSACPTMRGRSDIFVGFIERGLRLLNEGGLLGFIVADRWMRNQYGAGLRKLISGEFAVDAVIQLHDVDAFEKNVSAYPAIAVLRRGPQRTAITAETTALFGQRVSSKLVGWAKTGEAAVFKSAGVTACRLPTWSGGDASWPTGSPEELALVADIESRFPLIEDCGRATRVGIGVASGADSVYLATDDTVVEADRLLPLVMARDIASGSVEWSGTHLVNPWADGKLVCLDDYPRLSEYLDEHAERICGRHVARRAPGRWYRTIDRVEPGLLAKPKLLLPDLKSSIHPVLDEGQYYPHHNLYFITSENWDLEVLGGLLLSRVANLFVGTYCVKMRGGCYRFQAQYLRRIRVPNPDSLSTSVKRGLAAAFAMRDVEAATEIALRVYDIDDWPVPRALHSVPLEV